MPSKARVTLTTLGAALVVATGVIHLGLTLTSYRNIPTIAALFWAQAISAFLLAILLVVVIRPVVALLGALFLLSTLGGYVLALLVSLFGFREVATSTGVAVAAIEIVGAGVLTAAAAVGVPGLIGRLLRLGTALAVIAPVAAVTPALALSSSTSASGGPATTIEAAQVGKFGSVLTSAKHTSLYLLTSEAGDHVTCKGGCLSLWPPVLVPDSVKKVTLGSGVSGHFGFVARSATTKQVTDNGYPLYTYVGDAKPGQATGQGIMANGGTWYLLRASARTPAATAVR